MVGRLCVLQQDLEFAFRIRCRVVHDIRKRGSSMSQQRRVKRPPLICLGPFLTGSRKKFSRPEPDLWWHLLYVS